MTFWQAIVALKKLVWIPGQKVLLANPPVQRQGLRQRLWCVFDIESGEAQTFRWSLIFVCTNISMEKSIKGLCDQPTHLN